MARQRLLLGLLHRLDEGTLEGLTASVQQRELDPLTALDRLIKGA